MRQYNVIVHIVHGKGVRPNNAACFGTHEPHLLFHINTCDKPGEMLEARQWADGLVRDLDATGRTMSPVYVSFMGDEEDPTRSFGGNWPRLKALKKTTDPDNLFRFAQPRLGSIDAD